MNDLIKRQFKLILIIAISLLVVSGAAYAAYLKSIPSHLKVVAPVGPSPPTISLEFYEHEECTTVCTFVEWEEITQGSQVIQQLFWVKNTGDVALIINGSSTLPDEAGELDIEFKKGSGWQDSLCLRAGEECETKGTLSILNTAPLGDVNFEINVGGTE